MGVCSCGSTHAALEIDKVRIRGLANDAEDLILGANAAPLLGLPGGTA
ncbi:MAG: hypothetical protein ACRD0A_18080 [Acidimicrobiales bacterium]